MSDRKRSVEEIASEFLGPMEKALEGRNIAMATMLFDGDRKDGTLHTASNARPATLVMMAGELLRRAVEEYPSTSKKVESDIMPGLKALYAALTLGQELVAERATGEGIESVILKLEGILDDIEGPPQEKLS